MTALAGAEGDGFVQMAHRRDPRLRALNAWLDSSSPRCGSLRVLHWTFVSEEPGTGLESAATVPLGDQPQLGFQVLAVRNPKHINRVRQVDLLRLPGDAVAAALIGTTAPVRAGACPKLKGG